MSPAETLKIIANLESEDEMISELMKIDAYTLQIMYTIAGLAQMLLGYIPKEYDVVMNLIERMWDDTSTTSNVTTDDASNGSDG